MQTIILQILVFQLCFLVVYELLLRKETFFNWNRAYLLITSVVSLVVPFIKLKSFATVIPAELMINLPAVVLGESKPIQPNLIESSDVAMLASEPSFSIALLWYVGVAFFGGLLVFKLLKIWRFKQSCKAIQKKGYSIVTLNNSEDAFSFWNHIFLGDRLESTQKESILKHEKVHVQEKHTIDLLWFEILRIVFWFNPLVYIYQKRITEVHEFIADKSASKHQQNYYENLLAKTFNIAQFSVVNQFYSSSLIKKRIIMLTKEKSNKRKLVKYMAIIPIVLGMLVYVSCTDALEIENNTEVVASSETSVIEDVSRLVKTTLPVAIKSEEITQEQYDVITAKLKKYIDVNQVKIEQTGLTKYFDYYQMTKSSNDSKNNSEERKDYVVFLTASMQTSVLIKELGGTNDIKKIKNILSIFTTSEIFTRLEELNYKFPNEAKWKALYEDYLKNVKAGTVPDYGDEVPFTVIDQSPIYPGCDENATPEDLKKCFSRSIAIHVNKNFNTKIAKANGLVGRHKIFVGFKIDKEGNLKDLKARAPHEALAAEAERVLNLLPNMKPGTHEGETVTVPYSLPIIIQID